MDSGRIYTRPSSHLLALEAYTNCCRRWWRCWAPEFYLIHKSFQCTAHKIPAHQGYLGSFFNLKANTAHQLLLERFLDPPAKATEKCEEEGTYDSEDLYTQAPSHPLSCLHGLKNPHSPPQTMMMAVMTSNHIQLDIWTLHTWSKGFYSAENIPAINRPLILF